MRGPRLQICVAAALAIGASSGCGQSSLRDLPLWRVEIDPSGKEVRLVSLPFEQVSYDMKTNQVVRRVEDRNQDGVSDRITVYEGLGGARLEETDTDFDGHVDRWDTFGSEGQRLRSASASIGLKADRMATYDVDGRIRQIQIDSDHDGTFETARVFEKGRLVEIRIDGDANGRVDRVQDYRRGFMDAEDFDTNEDGQPDLRMTYGRDGALIRVTVLAPGNSKR
jgi:hypothetical protein